MTFVKRRFSLRPLLITVAALIAPFALLFAVSLISKVIANSGPLEGPFVAWGVSALVVMISALCLLSVIAFPIACIALYYQLFMLFIGPNHSVDLTAPAPGLMNLPKPDRPETGV